MFYLLALYGSIVGMLLVVFYLGQGPKGIYTYEASLVASHVVLILLCQAITGPFIRSILWVLSFAIVTMSYVDHICIGWKKRLTGVTQLRRLLWSALGCLVAGLGLYYSILFLVPKVDAKNLRALLDATHDLLRVHNAFGPFIYAYLYALFYISTLSFFRFVVNVGYTVFMVIEESYRNSQEQ